ncbi:MAG: ATP-dependent metallopeptidase FtsH/Yme1/Tma family protein, partial [Xanthomonadales bacterium]|nr:ATP-dependent metallopeptidase FtsH/Yme1/Tma family protein [Xanthomonadales bacterium]
MKNLLLWSVIALVLLAVFRNFGPTTAPSAGLSYSEFLERVEREQVVEVKIAADRKMTGKMQDGKAFELYAPEDPRLVETLIANNVKVTQTPPETGFSLFGLLLNLLPVLLLIGFWIFVMRQMQGGGGG